MRASPIDYDAIRIIDRVRATVAGGATDRDVVALADVLGPLRPREGKHVASVGLDHLAEWRAVR